MTTTNRGGGGFTLLGFVGVIIILALIIAIIILNVSGSRRVVVVDAGLRFEGTINESLAQALVGEWLFDDGFVRDSTSYGADGAAHGAAVYGSCVTRQCFSFDGVNDYLEIEQHSALEVRGLTISVWIKPKRKTGVDDQWLIAGKISNAGSTAADWALYYGTHEQESGALHFDFSNAQSREHTSTSEVPIGKWSHVLVTFDPVAETVRFFLNGDLIGKSTETGRLPRTASRNLIIGQSGKGAFDGYIDNLRIYAAAL
jgi:hypothetical protein